MWGGEPSDSGSRRPPGTATHARRRAATGPKRTSSAYSGPFTSGHSQWAVHSGPFTVGRSDPGLEGRDDFVILGKTTGFVFGVHEVAVNDDVEYPLLALDQLGLD